MQWLRWFVADIVCGSCGLPTSAMATYITNLHQELGLGNPANKKFFGSEK